jgi:hypothetical protein
LLIADLLWIGSGILNKSAIINLQSAIVQGTIRNADNIRRSPIAISMT